MQSLLVERWNSKFNQNILRLWSPETKSFKTTALFNLDNNIHLLHKMFPTIENCLDLDNLKAIVAIERRR